jgi:hypothetical protein
MHAMILTSMALEVCPRKHEGFATQQGHWLFLIRFFHDLNQFVVVLFLFHLVSFLHVFVNLRIW